MEDNHRYLSSLATLKAELKEARNEFEFLSKYVKMLKSGTQSLENILNDGKSSSNKMGLGFSEGTFATTSTTMFAKASDNIDHGVTIKEEQIEWRPRRRNDRCNVALTSVHLSRATDWYFDSGSSWHMTGNAAFFTNFKEYSAGHVMFGDRVREKIIGKGSINQPGLSCLQDVRLVKGMSTNLISISQLCE
ncbi:gag-pol polyprotein [Cucumis melo var. makuwa]|uniref:Gag-pol polyprotein n=1 Tax=Cucumis melo var. makuwa TaxID=1194695 RepID=A0A5D3D296_CUCMM|nr:gag-pol polyprotein [Cucumis melo var. makuwa]TYK18027.1 gag-pol polyprotein [Cucumis melo var. makuwa]